MKPIFLNRRVKFVLLCVLAVLFLLPVFWMFFASATPRGVPLLSKSTFSLEVIKRNFFNIWQILPLGRFTFNSLLVVGLAVPITLVVSSLAGFSISQLPKSIQKRWVILSLAVLMVPGVALWMSRFWLYKALGWYNTIWALIAPAWMGTSPFYVLMFYRAFRRIPEEIYVSARLDGAGAVCLWWKIALPMVKPTTIAVAFLSFLVYWGDYVSPLLYLQTEDRYTLVVALQLLRQMGTSDWSLLMTASVYVTMFPLLFFLFIQKDFGR